MTIAELVTYDNIGSHACVIAGKLSFIENDTLQSFVPLADVYAEASDAMQRQMSGKRAERPVGEIGYLISGDVIPF